MAAEHRGLLWLVTAFGSESDRAYAVAAGCAEFVEKPISSTELPTIIRRHLMRHE